MVNEKYNRRKIIIILLITIVYAFIMSYVINKLYTFSCFSHNDKRAIMIVNYLINLVYSFIASKLSGITLEDMGIMPKLFPRYLLLLIPGMIMQLIHIYSGTYTLTTGITNLFLYLLVAVCEEIFCRGLILTLILKISHSNKYAILIQAVIFGLIHYFNASYGALSPCIEAMVFAVILASIRIYLPEGMGMPIAILIHWLVDM